jgi:hypothetical protein
MAQLCSGAFRHRVLGMSVGRVSWACQLGMSMHLLRVVQLPGPGDVDRTLGINGWRTANIRVELPLCHRRTAYQLSSSAELTCDVCVGLACMTLPSLELRCRSSFHLVAMQM